MTDKPKLRLPGGKAEAKPPVAKAPVDRTANKVPPPVDHEPGFGELLGTIIQNEIDRVGRDRNVLFDAVMARITKDDTIFRRIGTALLHKTCRKRIKRTLERLAIIEAAKGKT